MILNWSLLLGLCVVAQSIALPTPTRPNFVRREDIEDGSQIGEGWKGSEDTVNGYQIGEGWKRDQAHASGSQIGEGW